MQARLARGVQACSPTPDTWHERAQFCCAAGKLVKLQGDDMLQCTKSRQTTENKKLFQRLAERRKLEITNDEPASMWLSQPVCWRKSPNRSLPCSSSGHRIPSHTAKWLEVEEIQGEIIYAPPPSPISGQKAFSRGGGWGCIFWGPARQKFYTPPPFIHPPPLGGYFQGWGGGGV